MTKREITPGTLARLLFLVVTLANQALLMSGHVPIDLDENTIYTGVSTLATIAAAVVAAWKNNSVTQAALEGDAVMKGLKAARKKAK